MRVLDRNAAGGGRRIRCEGQVAVAGCTGGAVGAHADPCVEVEVVAARALVGVGHGTALGQAPGAGDGRSEEHTSELQSLMRSAYAVFCLKKKNETEKSKKVIR